MERYLHFGPYENFDVVHEAAFEAARYQGRVVLPYGAYIAGTAGTALQSAAGGTAFFLAGDVLDAIKTTAAAANAGRTYALGVRVAVL